MIARAFSIAGGLLFASSIGYFLWFYLFDLDRRGPSMPPARALAFNTALFAIFAIHHSVFARHQVRGWIARHVSPRLERTWYVWFASLSFGAVCVFWEPTADALWHAEGLARWLLRAVQFSGISITLWAAGALDGLALAGIRQLDHPLPASGIEQTSVTLQHTGPYGLVRHPIYFGWLLIVWAAPTFTVAHALFAAISSAYLVVATIYEERSLHQTFGPAYADYARTVRKKMIPGVY